MTRGQLLLRVYRFRATMNPMTDAMVRIGGRARGLAAERRMTQEQVADILGISRKAVGLRFNGKVPFAAHEVELLADRFGIDPGEFFRPAA